MNWVMVVADFVQSLFAEPKDQLEPHELFCICLYVGIPRVN